MKEVIFNNELTDIGIEAFFGCKQLNVLHFGNKIGFTNINFIGEYAFTWCTNLKMVYFEDTCLMSELPVGTFDHCSALQTVVLPKSLIEISAEAFKFCNKLKMVNFSDLVKLKSVGKAAFAHCIALEHADFCDSVTLIDEGAFQECLKLKSLRISKCLNELSANVFNNCVELRTIFEIESSNIRTIEQFAFFKCKKLEAIQLPDVFEKIEEKASCEKLKDVEYKPDRIHIANTAFNGCIYSGQ